MAFESLSLGIRELTKSMDGFNVASFQLAGIISRAVAQQGDLQRVLISTGNQSAQSIGNLNKTFNNVGLSMTQSIQMFTAMSNNSLKLTDQATKNTLARQAILGKDLQAVASNVAFNTQVLGLSKDSSLQFADTLLEVGAAYGMNSDNLVKAMNSLAQTFIQNAAVYGKGTTEALRNATTELIGRYGAGNAELVKEMAQGLFGGTEKSTRMAAMLGLDIAKLATTDSKQMITLFNEALQSLQGRVGGAAGTGMSGLIIPKLLAAFGATPGMLQLANLGPMTEKQLAMSAEELATQQLQADLFAQFNSIMKDLTVMLMPIVTGIAHVTKFLAHAFTAFGGLLKNILIVTLATKSLNAFRNSLMLKNIHTDLVMNKMGMMKSGISFLGGPIGIGISAALTLLPMLFGLFEDGNKTNKDILSEQEKTTAALVENTNNKFLGEIATAMTQANIYNLGILNNSEEHLEVSKDIKDNPVSAGPIPNMEFSLPPTNKA
tara:strand:+ start:1343 stop:2815 length:1473 start_codon:yes stop_codon:yes gene_type:complete